MDTKCAAPAAALPSRSRSAWRKGPKANRLQIRAGRGCPWVRIDFSEPVKLRGDRNYYLPRQLESLTMLTVEAPTRGQVGGMRTASAARTGAGRPAASRR